MRNWALKQLLIWGGLAMLAAMIMPHLVQQQPTPPRANPAIVLPASPPVPAPPLPQAATPNELSFPADAHGHVFVDALVNGRPVHFLVDTGATEVSLTMADAKAAGIDTDNLNFVVPASTANGTASAAAVTLQDITIGQMPVFQVAALVHPKLGISLLGQSFLTRLRSYSMQGGQLTLEWN
jgi:aspartyl protease family protein